MDTRQGATQAEGPPVKITYAALGPLLEPQVRDNEQAANARGEYRRWEAGVCLFGELIAQRDDGQETCRTAWTPLRSSLAKWS